MIVCVCRRVSDKDIHHHASLGMSFDEIQGLLGVSTQCGCCENMTRGLIQQSSCSNPLAAIEKNYGIELKV